MKLSDTDKRELCPRHGWVGRRAFQLDRHDLCEAPIDAPLLDEEGSRDDEASSDEIHGTLEVESASEDIEPSTETLGAGGLSEDASVISEAEEASQAEDVEDVEDVGVQGAGPLAAREEGLRRRRKNPPKKTLAVRRITQLALAAGRAELQALGGDDPYDRPRVRGDCRWCPVCQLVRDGKSDGSDEAALQALGDARAAEVIERFACGHRAAEVIFRSRPCAFVACKHSLYLDVSETGSIILNFPYLEPGQMPVDRSCALDLAERGVMTLEDIASVTNLTRERIRQVELKALTRRARSAAVALGLGPEDAAAAGARHQVGPGADLEETGIEGGVPSDVASLLSGSGGRGT